MFSALLNFFFPAAPPLVYEAPFEWHASAHDLFFPLSFSPELTSEAFAPFVQAKAALVMDVHSGKILYQKKAHQPLAMASLTKIMTAILILEDHAPEEVVRVQNSFVGLKGVRMHLQTGESMTVENLIKGLLIPSGGDAAVALAEHHSGTVEAFVEAMNQRGPLLGLHQMRFENPVGLDAPDHYATAYELALLTQYALRFPAFRQVVGIPLTSVASTDGKIIHELKNTNRLLESYLDVRGVKTGTTDDAGQSVITLVRHPQGHEILTVLLNSPNRFQEAKSMSHWALENFKWQ